MIAAGVAGLVLGCLLGLRFRVMILVPVEMAALAAAGTLVLCGLASGITAVAAVALFSVGLQVSYVAAIVVAPIVRVNPMIAADA